MKTKIRYTPAVIALMLGSLSACARAENTDKSTSSGSTASPTQPAPVTPQPRTDLTPEQRKQYLDVARLAWVYFERNYKPATGFVNATPVWANTSLWDVGGQLLATHAAKELGIITRAEYDQRTKKTLATLEQVPLFQDKAFNKLYSTQSVAFGTEGRKGWSSTDLGRLLLALKIIAVTEPQYAAQVERIARRNDFSKIVIDGYLNGQLIGSNGEPWSFQEGRIGYEQYSAAGFNQWGANASNAAKLSLNAEPIDVFGVQLLADKRQNDRLLSEPFILMALELGLPADMRDLASKMLQAQQARYTRTGQLTIVSEDAVSVPPEYFYYYCVLCNRKPFVVDLASPGHETDHPKWVSTKAAYGWDAIMPSDYTKKAVAAVQAARDAKLGWGSGVYEGTGASTKTVDINTSAVLLEIALYQLRGGIPLIQPASVQLR